MQVLSRKKIAIVVVDAHMASTMKAPARRDEEEGGSSSDVLLKERIFAQLYRERNKEERSVGEASRSVRHKVSCVRRSTDVHLGVRNHTQNCMTSGSL